MDLGEPDTSIDRLIHGNLYSDEFQDIEISSFLNDLSDSGVPSSSSSKNGETSSSDNSPPLSNFTGTEGECWDFNFHNEEGYSLVDNRFGYQGSDDPFLHDNNFFPEMNQEIENFDVENCAEDLILPPTPATSTVIEDNNKHSNGMFISIPQHRTIRLVTLPPVQPIQIPQPQSIIKTEKRLVPIAPSDVIPNDQTQYTATQNRKIRNRMYAQQSRLRKKEEEEKMRRTIIQLQNENATLKSENSFLKKKLAEYENNNIISLTPPYNSPSSRFSTSPKHISKRQVIVAGSTLMVFSLLVIISPLSIGTPTITHISSKTPLSDTLSIRHSRVLPIGSDKVETFISNISSNNSSMNECGMYKLNASEALRVNDDIDKWVRIHSFDDKPMKFVGGFMSKNAMKTFNKNNKIQRTAKRSLLKSEKAAYRSRERTWRQLDQLKLDPTLKTQHENVLNKKENIDKLANIIRQKSDTIYLIALQDYVLLPSLKKGPNYVPKFSLILPKTPMNGTLVDENSLLRVECEVTGTGHIVLSNKQLLDLIP